MRICVDLFWRRNPYAVYLFSNMYDFSNLNGEMKMKKRKC